MMNEKRYYVSCAGYLCDKDLSNTLSIFECADLLNQLTKENEKLRKTINEVIELLLEEVDLFSDKATEHDIIAYKEMNQFDNKDAYYMCTATKKAIEKLKRWNDE